MSFSTIWMIIAAELLSVHLCSMVFVEHPQSEIHLKVHQLTAMADFHSVRLSWHYEPPTAFIVKHCEMVVWGRDKCVSRTLNASTEIKTNDVDTAATADAAIQSYPTTYQTTVGGLRLATNYSFEVQPLMTDVDDQQDHRGLSVLQPTLANARSLDDRKELIVATKAFSAHPRTCLGDRTEVDIETGPNFGGHVSVEGAYDRRCTWIGDERDSNAVHTFVIDHKLCGGGLKEGRIETVVIVSESRSIITHTARRFMVVCNLVPETYTIKASINVPTNRVASGRKDDHPNEIAPENSVMDSELSYEHVVPLGRPANNRRISSQHTAELRQMAQLLEGNRNDTTAAHLILMVVLVVAVSVGTVATAWWFIAQRSRAGRFDLAAAEYDERLPSCRNVVVMPGQTNDVVNCSLDQEFDEARSDNRELQAVDVPMEIDWGMTLRSTSSVGSLGKPCLMQLESSRDDLCATTLVLAPSITAAFQSSGDSCC